jgi:stage II sporulation protein D
MALAAPAERALQDAVERSLAGKTGAVLVAEVATGKLLAQHGREGAAARRVAPGSAVKPFVLRALLETGKLEAGAALPCPRVLELAGRRLDCTHPAVGFPMDPATALAYSCNNYFARMAARLGEHGLAEALSQVGRVRLAATAEELQLQALGEAGIEVTPLDLLSGYRRLALEKGKGSARLAPLFAGLEGAVEYGTAQLARPQGLTVAGKTGTSAGRHAWFAGYAPAEKPEVVVVVLIEGGRGGSAAAPVARAIFEAWARGRPRGRLVTVRIGGQARALAMERYVAAVLSGECDTSTSKETLKAMAVTARTWAQRHLGRHRAEGADFCDTTHCQRVRLEAITEGFREAVEATEGEMLWYDGAPAAAYYHGHCGGSTETGANVWPDLRAPYLKSVEDAFCVATGRSPWSTQVLKADLARALGLKGPVAMEVTRRTPAGRVAELRLGGRRWSGAEFETAAKRGLGGYVLKSNLYEVADEGTRLAFRGYGAGHGVGLCQAGAAERGRQGHNYRQILAFYFPGTLVGVSARGLAWTRMGGERVEVWSTRPQQDARLVELADRALGEAERRAGFAARSRPRVRVYPTVAVFRDATGEPGTVAASTLGGTIRLQPAALLGERLKATLLHEMLHVVVEERAHPSTPGWFREGLVQFLARDGQAPGAEARVGAMVKRHGREAVMRWLEQGLPP